MRRELITSYDPKSPVSEVFRTLRTNIQFMNSSHGLKSLLVTSTLPEEGKSWVASNLAVTFAQAGKKVVLIDADMRKGRQFSIFNVKPIPGLSNFLSGLTNSGKESNEDIFTYIQQTSIDNLYVIPAGNVPPNPSELLISDKMAEMLTRLEQFCDIVIFDGTPSALVTDAVIVSRLVDSTIIVTAYKRTKADNLKKIVKSIQNVGGKIAGVVINKMPVSQKEYKEKYYYGSSYTMPVPIKNRKAISYSREEKEVAIKIEQPTREKNIQEKKEIPLKVKEKQQIEERYKESVEYKQEENKKHIYDFEKEEKDEKENIEKIENKKVEDTPRKDLNTEDLLKDINSYLEREKAKLSQGEKHD